MTANFLNHTVMDTEVTELTCESAGLSQQEGAPGHEEEEGGLQQREVMQLSEFGDVESS